MKYHFWDCWQVRPLKLYVPVTERGEGERRGREVQLISVLVFICSL